MISTEAVRFNKDQTITTEAGNFLVEQRNAGYADNDGKWVVNQLIEIYWSTIGTMRQRRPSKFLGIFDTIAEAEAAILGAEAQPIDDKMIG